MGDELASGGKRSAMITAVACVHYFSGGLLLVLSAMALILLTLLRWGRREDPGARAIQIYYIVTMVMALAMFLAGYGVQKRRQWGAS
jgi:hypothetical protein